MPGQCAVTTGTSVGLILHSWKRRGWMRWPLGPISPDHDFKDSKLAMFQFLSLVVKLQAAQLVLTSQWFSRPSEGSWLCMRPSQSSSHTQVQRASLVAAGVPGHLPGGLCPRGS